MHLKYWTTRKVLKLRFIWEKISNKHGYVPASLTYETVFQMHEKKRLNTVEVRVNDRKRQLKWGIQMATNMKRCPVSLISTMK